MCRECNPGFYNEQPFQPNSSEPAILCEPCPIGTKSEVFGTKTVHECKPCSKGTHCPKGSSHEKPCPSKWFCPSPSQKIPCIGGFVCTTNTTTLGQDSLCSPGNFCPTGTNDPRENICPIGHSCPRGSSEPQPCPIGTYQDEVGKPTCKLCGVGTFGIAVRGTDSKTACAPCPASTFNDVPGIQDVSECKNCKIGKTSKEGSSFCSQCQAGEFLSQNKKCKICAEGSFSIGGAEDECELCPKGRFADKGRMTCSLCPPGKHGNNLVGFDNETMCVPCSEGRFSNASGFERDDQCVPCPAGTIVLKGVTGATSEPEACEKEKTTDTTTLSVVVGFIFVLGIACFYIFLTRFANVVGARLRESLTNFISAFVILLAEVFDLGSDTFAWYDIFHSTNPDLKSYKDFYTVFVIISWIVSLFAISYRFYTLWRLKQKLKDDGC